ncbi:MAG: competence protein ComEC family protein [Holosporales bacterium]|jgi:competence protein ComEC|nr:competence protein ComEC family protein [Holosporales bacterium]
MIFISAFIRKILNAGLRNLLEESNRWRLWVPVALGIGISFYFWLPLEPPLWIGWSIGSVVFVLFGVGQHWKDIRNASPFMYFCLAGCVCFSLGFNIAATRTAFVNTTLLYRTFRCLDLEGTVYAIEKTPKGGRLVLEHINVKTQRKIPPLQRISLIWRGDEKRYFPIEELTPGIYVRTRATLFPIKPPVAPESFDFRRHAFFQNISAYGFLIEPPVILKNALEKKNIEAFSAWGTRLRFKVNRRIEKVLPSQVGAIACALTTGEKSGIEAVVRQHFADSGTAHILAISGLHMTLVGGLFFLTGRCILCCLPYLIWRPHAKKLAAVAAWLGTLGYLGLSGAGIPSIRAFLMNTIVTLAILLNRVALSMSSVALAAIFILLATPEALISPSFQMSFSAVIALIATYERSKQHTKRRRIKTRGLAYVANLSLTSFIASLATTPFSVHTFQQCSLMSIPANMLAVPLTGMWIMPCAVGALFLMPFAQEKLFLKMMGWGITYLMKIAQTVAHWPGAHIVITPPKTCFLGLFVLGALWIILWRRRWRLLGILPMGCAVGLYLTTPLPDFMVDGAATCVGGHTATHSVVIAKNRARTAQKVWGNYLGLSKKLQRGGLLLRDGFWCFSEKDRPLLFVTNTSYHGNAPSKEHLHIDLSGKFPNATLTRQEILDGLGGYIYLHDKRSSMFQSVRKAVGNRPWSFKGYLVPYNIPPKRFLVKKRVNNAPHFSSKRPPITSGR